MKENRVEIEERDWVENGWRSLLKEEFVFIRVIREIEVLIGGKVYRKLN